MAGDLRRSPLDQVHRELGARLVGFGGWEMPLSYPQGTLGEHMACRRGAAVFDVSHLGTVRVEGPGALERLQGTLTNDLGRIGPGRAQYSHLCATDGSVLDDIIVWWVGPETFEVMPNASNTARVLQAVGGRDTTAERAVLAVQGPQARAKLAQVFPEAASVARFTVARCRWGEVACWVAGTGYTGEDGVEIAVPAEAARGLFQALLAAGIAPAGLGARDTLRLEAGLPLYGHELGPGITPLQAGLGWVVSWDKGDFTGRAALEEERATGVRRALGGVRGEGRRPLREGGVLVRGDQEVGRVTSGNFSPMLGCGIGMALVDTAAARRAGDPVEVVRPGVRQAAVLADLPLWRRGS